MIARVFPRRTKATPDDALAFTGPPPLFGLDDVTEVHVSVAFTWDMKKAEWLAKDWERIAPVKVGGPATGEKSGDFVPGMYLKHGYTITSRGCPNHCWFCSVWKRDGSVREFPVKDGWNVLDDNLLACSPVHFEKVMEMLGRQKNRVEFTGGLEAARLTDWHVDRLVSLKIRQMFFAYDTPDDWEPLVEARKKLDLFRLRQRRCYVLIGYPGDIIEKAVQRLWAVLELGYLPMAMLWQDGDESAALDWKKIQWRWTRPAVILSMKAASDRGCQLEAGPGRSPRRKPRKFVPLSELAKQRRIKP